MLLVVWICGYPHIKAVASALIGGGRVQPRVKSCWLVDVCPLDATVTFVTPILPCRPLLQAHEVLCDPELAE